LGNEKGQYQSVSNESYSPRGIIYQQLSDAIDIKQNLKQSKIVMGNDKVSYQSESSNMQKVNFKGTELISKTAGISMNSGEHAQTSHIRFNKGQTDYTTN